MKVEHLSRSLIPFLDFQLMAQAYGIKNYKFDNPETLAQDLEVITEDVPMLIEVDISRKEQVLPMVPAGKSIMRCWG